MRPIGFRGKVAIVGVGTTEGALMATEITEGFPDQFLRFLQP